MMNIKEYLDSPYYYKIISSHREWLKPFGLKFLSAWDNLFKNNNSEAALCEAATRQVLEELDIVVEQFDDPSTHSLLTKSKLFLISATLPYIIYEPHYDK